MILHSDDQYGTALLINSAIPILARRVYLVNYFLFLADLVRLVALIPLHPLCPHLAHLFFLKLSCYAESSHRINVRVEITAVLQMGEFFVKNLNYQFLLGFHLSQLTITNSEWVIALHYNFNQTSLKLFLIQLFLFNNKQSALVGFYNSEYKSGHSYKLMDTDTKTEQKKKNNHAQREQNEGQVGPDPRKLQKLDLHDLLLENIPSAQNYQISYMHRDTVNNIIISTKTDTIITFSIDGHIKFWKKVFCLVEFVKNFKAHNNLITCASLSKNHDLLCTAGIDKTLKIFDVLNCDLRTIIRLPFTPSACQFLPRKGFDLPSIALSQQKAGKIVIIDIQKHFAQQDITNFDQQNEFLGNDDFKQSQKPQKQQQQDEKQFNFNEHIIKTINIHKHPVKFIKMNWNYNFCVSIDERSCLQVWNPQTYDLPTNTKYRSKMQTEFLQLIKLNLIPISMQLSPKGNLVGIFLKDRNIRVYDLINGKLIASINQSIKQITRIQQQSTHQRHSQEVLDQTQFQKKLGIQKDIQVSKEFLNAPHLDFDQSEQFLIYPSFRGIKIYSLGRKCVERILGKKQHQRFIKVFLYQGRVMRNPSGTSNSSGQRKSTDPTIYCTSYKRPRFYIFSRRSPEIGPQNDIVRDIVNEKMAKDQQISKDQIRINQKKSEVTLHTTLGDITVQLFSEDCPKTCQNFTQLSKKGYYNNLIFHRVIKGFMNQTGCPKGDGTGGQSIWGGYFEDELCPQKHRFDRPYLIAMANRGPGTNGSQFFITVVACPWLDNKHTVFGRVIKGIQTVCQINKIKTDKSQKPLVNVKIISTTIK